MFAERENAKAALEATIPALTLLGDYIGNEFTGGKGIAAFDRCAIIGQVRQCIQSFSTTPEPVAKLEAAARAAWALLNDIDGKDADEEERIGAVEVLLGTALVALGSPPPRGTCDYCETPDVDLHTVAGAAVRVCRGCVRAAEDRVRKHLETFR